VPYCIENNKIERILSNPETATPDEICAIARELKGARVKLSRGPRVDHCSERQADIIHHRANFLGQELGRFALHDAINEALFPGTKKTG